MKNFTNWLCYSKKNLRTSSYFEDVWSSYYSHMYAYISDMPWTQIFIHIISKYYQNMFFKHSYQQLQLILIHLQSNCTLKNQLPKLIRFDVTKKKIIVLLTIERAILIIGKVSTIQIRKLVNISHLYIFETLNYWIKDNLELITATELTGRF